MVSNGRQRRALQWIIPGLLIILLLGLLPMAAAQEEEYSVGVQQVADGFAAPVALTTANDGSGRLFVVDQVGTIWIIGSDGQKMPDPFLDLSGLIAPLSPDYDERGVLGLAFHPDYANNGRFFVYYAIPLRAEAPVGWDHTNVVAEFNVSSDDPNKGDPATQKTVLQIDQPEGNHNAGHIAFGPDGCLYIPIGDGGGANDKDVGHTENLGNAQDLTNLHGGILRIDVNGDPGNYTIPADNPFANGEMSAAPEIYAYGLRNPYHISFDRGGNHDLFAADAGQNIYEEVDMITAGGNYGWNIKEGTHCFDPNTPDEPPATCASTSANGEPLVDPIIEYSHDDVGVVVVGGYVYRGSALSDLEGYYIFGDFSKSFDNGPDGSLLWAEPSDEGGAWEWGELKVAGMANDRLGLFVRAFGEGEDGELYVMTSENVGPTGDTGKVWKLVPGEAGSTPEATRDPNDTEEPAATEEASG